MSWWGREKATAVQRELREKWPAGSPLDLNHPPEEFGKLAVEESSAAAPASTESTKLKKKKNGGKDESGKVYECRFCSLKFCKSQALGGHMNRHRQERETETLNRARQLVYSNEGLSATGVHLGLRELNALGGTAPAQYSAGYPAAGRAGGIGDQCLQFPPLYPRLPLQSAAAGGALHPCIYPPSSASPHPISFPPPYRHSFRGDYYIGHVLPTASPRPIHGREPSYTCFGTPLGHNLPIDRIRPPAVVQDGAAAGNQIDGINWSCGYGVGHHAAAGVGGGDPGPDIDPSFP